MSGVVEGLPVSIQARLARHARAIGMDPNLVLARFGLERFLYRLSRSPHAGRFVLKGALLMLVWLGESLRPTRDADLPGFGDISEATLTRIFTDVCQVDVEPDGLECLAPSLRIAPIRTEDAYGGLRAHLEARLGKARVHLQIDIGVGDAVSPEPVWLDYPAMLGLPRPHLRAYRPETAIAEKLHAMVVLGEANSRMRHFFDIHALARHEPFDGGVLVRAIRATFDRRRTPISPSLPLALTREFGELPQKRIQWQGFLRKSGGLAAPHDFAVVVTTLSAFLEPALAAARDGGDLQSKWLRGGPWAQNS